MAGYINFNAYDLPRNKFLDKKSTDESIEIIDNADNVIFSLKYERGNIIRVKGYYVSKRWIYVVNDGVEMFDVRNKAGALQEIEKIPKTLD